MVTKKHSGACLCGAVRFEITGAFEQFFLCHCSRCRKGSGSAHGANLFSTTAKITWLSGEDKIRTFRVPDSRHERSFCSECGSMAPGVKANGSLLIVPAGSLDTPITIRPTAHICTASRADWDNELEAIPAFDHLPQ